LENVFVNQGRRVRPERKKRSKNAYLDTLDHPNPPGSVL
jgi:hypothetical protein